MEEPHRADDAPAARSHAMPRWLPWVALPLLVALAYEPVRHAGFLWDDDDHLTENACIVGSKGFWDIWTSHHARICPLVISSFWLQHAIFGLHPLPYHLVNVALHAGAALVLWRVLLALKIRGAWLGAALWALHPVQVESVAWITELKNTQSALFYMLAILCFVRTLRQEPASGRRRWNVALVILFAAMAMTSKASTVVLPAILALCAWWVERAWHWRTLVRIAPVAALAILVSALAFWTQHLEGANEPEWHRGIAERVVTAGNVVWFYLGKLLWPSPLIFIYPRWTIDPARFIEWLPALAVVLGLAFLGWRRHGVLRPLFMTAACFITALLPVLGLFDHFFLRYSFVGDHFQYLASMAPLALAGAATAMLPQWFGQRRIWVSMIAGSIVVGLLGFMTWRQVPIYKDSETLWRHTLAHNPGAWMAWNNLAIIFTKSGRHEEAIAHYQRSYELYPRNHLALRNLGMHMLREGNAEEALARFEQVLAIQPDAPDALTNKGNALVILGRADDALRAWQDAVKAAPNYVDAHLNLCVAYLQKGRMEEALMHGEKAQRLRPDDAPACNAYGSALRGAGRVAEAIVQFQKSIKLRPDDSTAHNNLANALRQAGRMAEAVPHYAKAAELVPDSIPVLNNLAWALATCPDEKARDGTRAVATSLRCLELFGSDNASLMRTLAAGFAAEGKFDRAREIAERALQMIRSDPESAELAATLQRDLELYRSGQVLIERAP
jgi:Flp pilus assembly protein TadD